MKIIQGYQEEKFSEAKRREIQRKRLLKKDEPLLCECVQSTNFQVPIDPYSYLKTIYWVAILLACVFPTTALISLTEGAMLIFGTLPQYLTLLAIIQLILGSVLLFILLFTIYIQNNPINWQKPYRYVIAFLWFTLSIALFVVGFLMIDSLQGVEQSCDTSIEQIWTKSLYEDSIMSEALCTAQCPCRLQFQKEFQPEKLVAIKPFIDIADSAAVNAFECESKLPSPFTPANKNILRLMERDWGCAGICKNSEIYRFTDVNLGPPSYNGSCWNFVINVQIRECLVMMKNPNLVLGIFLALCSLAYLKFSCQTFDIAIKGMPLYRHQDIYSVNVNGICDCCGKNVLKEKQRLLESESKTTEAYSDSVQMDQDKKDKPVYQMQNLLNFQRSDYADINQFNKNLNGRDDEIDISKYDSPTIMINDGSQLNYNNINPNNETGTTKKNNYFQIENPTSKKEKKNTQQNQ